MTKDKAIQPYVVWPSYPLTFHRYEDRTMGFAMSVPEGWLAVPFHSNDAIPEDGVEFRSQNPIGRLRVGFRRLTVHRSLTDYINQDILCGDAAAIANRCPQGDHGLPVVISGVPGRWLSVVAGPLPSTEVLTSRGDTIVTILSGLPQGEGGSERFYSPWDMLLVFSNALESFAFLSPN